MSSSHSKGIQRQDLHQFIQLLKNEFPFPNEILADEFTTDLEKYATSCDPKGTTSTVYGNLDNRVSLHGIFHFVEEPDGLVSVSYAVHTLEAELSTPGIKASIRSVLGVQEQVPLNPDIASSYLAKSALDELCKLGVTTLPISGLSSLI